MLYQLMATYFRSALFLTLILSALFFSACDTLPQEVRDVQTKVEEQYESIKELTSEEKMLSKRVDDAFEPLNCSIAYRNLDASYYQGPLIDTHIHIAPIPDGPAGESAPDGDQPMMGVNV